MRSKSILVLTVLLVVPCSSVFAGSIIAWGSWYLGQREVLLPSLLAGITI